MRAIQYIDLLLENARTIEVPEKALNDITAFVCSVRDKYKSNKIKSSVKKEFKIDTENWKYKNLMKDKQSWWYSKDTILVKVSKADSLKGVWSGSRGTMVINVSTYASDDSIRSIVEHELIHWVQDFLGSGYGVSSFGQPKKDIRTPDIDQHATRTGRYKSNYLSMKLSNIPLSAKHSLDDIEFETDLLSAIRDFESEVKKAPKENHKKLFRIFVGLDEKPDVKDPIFTNVGTYFEVNSFFNNLKKYSLPKWREAVKKAMGVLDESN